MNLPVDNLSPGDWITFGLLIVATLTLAASTLATYKTSKALKIQTQSADVASYFQVTSLFSESWRRFRDADDKDDRSYEFCELLNSIESGCHLLKHDLFGVATKEMMDNDLREYITLIMKDDYGRRNMQDARSGSRTFADMKWFAEKHGIEWRRVSQE